ncbi:MAG: Glutamine transport ATP-binding protein GlnQ [bacterium ADurb.BinA028]|jgi:lipoprotein-releasing system ATP-binding protein|uniref:ATP-binding cassette domain-containing protein n=1 Tax=Candidatus Phosphoribacter hodrii TaxID=2953743 RepID=A0A935CCD9_9MICO|nr:ATP-binding cassette domain-containing protein [Candidatus Phosphoribacter hodrii]OPZ56292.1 MAG: Glutamine transport ATP-binding protein GlnQ [bacterium ADurb.BinA028]HBX79928.1 ABC transporter [Propionibacteriaceae bacterium]HRC13535.1 ATP-binding cassette domain-containing protein [Dermatophilaceae bacterium]
MHVSLAGVGHRFPGRPPLFADVSDDLQPAHVYALTGPSGSGKSTLLGIIAGWIDPTSGTVGRDGIRSVQWVFQSPYGVPGRSALDHVTLPLLARGLSRADAEPVARGLLDDMGLKHREHSPFRHLSGGEGQRLMIARALAAKPDLLLLDEPTAALDHRTAEEVIDVVSALARRDCIVVIATHDPRVQARCSDHISLADAS